MIRLAMKMAAAALIAFACVASREVRADEGVWIEVVETYEVPFDPDWRESALKASKLERAASFGLGGSGGSRSTDSASSVVNHFAGMTGSVDRAADYAARLKQSGTNERSQKSVLAALEKELRSFESSADAERELFVVRVWDGIGRAPATMIMGEKQRSIVARCKPRTVLHINVGKSNVPDHLQAYGRTTITSVIGGKAPTDFLSVTDGKPTLRDVSFGEADVAALSVGKILGEARKEPQASNGTIVVTFTLPTTIPFEETSPWYCQFILMELDKDGAPTKEVQFEGSKFAVSLSGKSAKGRIEVKNPTPFGYIVEAKQWFGVAPHAALKASTKFARPAASIPVPAK
jgi:hypothetical protein